MRKLFRLENESWMEGVELTAFVNSLHESSDLLARLSCLLLLGPLVLAPFSGWLGL